jgi:hypothetical protein
VLPTVCNINTLIVASVACKNAAVQLAGRRTQEETVIVYSCVGTTQAQMRCVRAHTIVQSAVVVTAGHQMHWTHGHMGVLSVGHVRRSSVLSQARSERTVCAVILSSGRCPMLCIRMCAQGQLTCNVTELLSMSTCLTGFDRRSADDDRFPASQCIFENINPTRPQWDANWHNKCDWFQYLRSLLIS